MRFRSARRFVSKEIIGGNQTPAPARGRDGRLTKPGKPDRQNQLRTLVVKLTAVLSPPAARTVAVTRRKRRVEGGSFTRRETAAAPTPPAPRLTTGASSGMAAKAALSAESSKTYVIVLASTRAGTAGTVSSTSM